MNKEYMEVIQQKQARIVELRMQNEQLRAALLWCGGFAFFLPEGAGHKGWVEIVAPLLGDRYNRYGDAVQPESHE